MKQKETYYKYIPFLSMVYISILFCSAFISNKVIYTPIGVIAAGSITGPFWFILSDIISEVYGFKMTKRIFFASMICEFVFLTIVLCLTKLPSPSSWTGQSAYDFIVDRFLYIYFCQLIAISIAWYLNTIILLKWKLILKGKYFWLRCIGASGIGATIFSFISPPLTLLGRESMVNLMHISLWSAALKLIFIGAFAYPASLLVSFLKDKEGVDIYDFSTLNPFLKN